MNRILYYLITLTAFIFSTLAWTVQHLPAEAQMRGEDSQEFFEEGQEQMQQNIQELEEENKKKEEPLLEENLNVPEKDANEPEVEDVVSPDGNKSEQPTDAEVEINF